MSRTMTRRRYLMCPAVHFDVCYSINPWMDPARPTAGDVALDQWQRLHDLFVDLGHQVEMLAPRPGLPDMVFAANGAIAIDGKALVARFRHHYRAAESPAYADWFGAQGWDVRQSESINEGEGDFLLAGNDILAGSGFRSAPGAHDEVRTFFSRNVVSLSLVDPRFYHLDTAVAVLSDDEIMYYPPAFAPESRELLASRYPDAIVAEESDAAVFGLNAVSDGLHVVLPKAAVGLTSQLVERGFEPIGVEMTELLKAGGAAKCCTLELRGGPTE